jgi:NNP family nitrate/nitrite transporter-like MFS transporter
MAVAQPSAEQSSTRHLALATASFFLCFAAWGLVSAFAIVFRTRFELDASRTALLVAVPVLLGAVARLPIGMLGDRYGGRIVFTALMLACAIPVALVPSAHTFSELLVVALFLGFAGASFAVGAGYVSRWTPKARQGVALGIFGLGTGGQSLAVFGGPLLAASIGWENVFRATAIALVAWGVLFAVVARDPPRTGAAPALSEMLGLLRRETMAWVLAAFYFLTFGGFVAFSIYLPTLLRDDFGLSAADAGFRAAGFVVLATAVRPVGGWLSDRIGGGRVLSGILVGVVPFALLLAWTSMVPFTVGALGCATLLGIGNGAVFKLVPELFPTRAGTVTGLVGAAGGLGGFFPPLVLGFFRDRFGVVWPGFLLLAAVAALLAWLAHRTVLAREQVDAKDRSPEWIHAMDTMRANAWATVFTGMLAAAIVVGSRNLRHFDPALVIYTFAVLFATWGIVRRYRVWLLKPPTDMYWRRGWEALWRGGLPRALTIVRVGWTHIFEQRFIRKRSRVRWAAHQLIFWGCLLAAAVTFPLVFGWTHFASARHDPMTYVAHAFGFPVGTFRVDTVFAWLLFHALDVSAILVLAGIAFALARRMRERGALALQTFGRDFFPLFLLFAVSVTGLALTVSTLALRGTYYAFLSHLHAVTVIATLLYLPFGKLFHVFQRPFQIGVKLYHEDADRAGPALCARCAQPFASQRHIDDLAEVLVRIGYDYRTDARAPTWQHVCPPCKRRSLALAQLALRSPTHGEAAASE